MLPEHRHTIFNRAAGLAVFSHRKRFLVQIQAGACFHVLSRPAGVSSGFLSIQRHWVRLGYVNWQF